MGKLQRVSLYLRDLGDVVEIEIANCEESGTSRDDSITSKKGMKGHSCQVLSTMLPLFFSSLSKLVALP